MVLRYLYCLSGVQKVLSRLFSLFISGFVSHRFQCVISQVFRHLVSRGASEKNYGPHRYVVDLGSFGSLHSLGGCETLYLSLLKRRKSISKVGFLRCKQFIVESSLTTLIRTIMLHLLMK